MATVKGFTEFSDKEIREQLERAKSNETDAKKEKAKRYALEMMAYNMRALRGDFDTY